MSFARFSSWGTTSIPVARPCPVNDAGAVSVPSPVATAAGYNVRQRAAPKSRARGRNDMAFRGLAFAFALIAVPAFAADYPAPKEGEWIARDFKFHTGEVLPEIRLAYMPIGEP